MNDVEVSFIKDELRPAFVLSDVNGADFQHVKARQVQDIPVFALTNVENFSIHHCWPLPDKRLERVKQEKLGVKSEGTQGHLLMERCARPRRAARTLVTTFFGKTI